VKVDGLGLRKVLTSEVKLSRENGSEGAQMNDGSNGSQIMGKAGHLTWPLD
jgi:hypothetical protein